MANARNWRCRVQIYTPGVINADLEGDTHPGLGDDEPLTNAFMTEGMPALLAIISDIIHTYHDAPPETLEGARNADLMKRVPSLRVYSSVQGGRYSFYVRYVLNNGAVGGLAKVTVERAPT